MRRPVTGENSFLMYDPHFSVPPSVDTDAALLARPWLLQRLPPGPASSEVAGQILAAVDALVSNVAEHARLTEQGTLAHSALLLLMTPPHVHLFVADQGPGLPDDDFLASLARPGRSLSLLRARLAALGAPWRSRPGTGASAPPGPAAPSSRPRPCGGPPSFAPSPSPARASQLEVPCSVLAIWCSSDRTARL